MEPMKGRGTDMDDGQFEVAHCDDLAIAYSDSGTGGLPIVLITGWCSTRGRYDLLVPLLAERGRVLAVDWRGHGDSSPTHEDFGFDELVDDVVAVVEAAGLEEFAIGSASHSGWAAIDLSRRLGARVPLVVHLDWLMFEPPPPYMNGFRMVQAEDTWEEGREQVFEVWRGGIEHEAVEQHLDVMTGQPKEMWMRSSREIEKKILSEKSALAAYEAMAEPPQVLHVYGQPEDPAYLERQQALAEELDWFDVAKLDAKSHFVMLETPAETAAVLGDRLARVGAAER
jgi:pimeloyl-ACP methyl ester carboxylesterase